MSKDTWTEACLVVSEDDVAEAGCVTVCSNSSKRVTYGVDFNRGCASLVTGMMLVIPEFDVADAVTNGARARCNGVVGDDCSGADSIVCEAATMANSGVGVVDVITRINDSIVDHAYENLVHLIRWSGIRERSIYDFY